MAARLAQPCCSAAVVRVVAASNLELVVAAKTKKKNTRRATTVWLLELVSYWPAPGSRSEIRNQVRANRGGRPGAVAVGCAACRQGGQKRWGSWELGAEKPGCGLRAARCTLLLSRPSDRPSLPWCTVLVLHSLLMGIIGYVAGPVAFLCMFAPFQSEFQLQHMEQLSARHVVTNVINYRIVVCKLFGCRSTPSSHRAPPSFPRTMQASVMRMSKFPLIFHPSKVDVDASMGGGWMSTRY